MRKRYLLGLGLLVLTAVLLVKPGISSAAALPTSAVDESLPAAAPATDASAPANQDAQQLVKACTDAHNLPTAEQRTEAMNKLMNDPNLAGRMGQIMSDPKLAGQMTQFMNSPEGRSAMGSMMNGAAGSMMSGSGKTTPGSSGCH